MMRRTTNQKKSPRQLWCFLGEYVVGLQRVTASTIPSLQGRTPHERQLGDTPDITPWVQHGWYNWVYYLDEDGEQKLGRWLGPAEKHGSADCYWILPLSCRPIVRSTVWAVPDADMCDPDKTAERNAFDAAV